MQRRLSPALRVHKMIPACRLPNAFPSTVITRWWLHCNELLTRTVAPHVFHAFASPKRKAESHQIIIFTWSNLSHERWPGMIIWLLCTDGADANKDFISYLSIYSIPWHQCYTPFFPPDSSMAHSMPGPLYITLRPRKMVNNLQTTIWNWFSCMKVVAYWLKFLRNLFSKLPINSKPAPVHIMARFQTGEN